MNTDTIIKAYEKKIQALLNENFQLFTENEHLKLGTKNTSTQAIKPTKKALNKKATKIKSKSTNKHLPMATIKANKEKNMQIVATEYQKSTPVTDIASIIGMSVPTVRNYIKELRNSNQLA